MNCIECGIKIECTWFKNNFLVHCHNCNTVFNINNPNKIKIKEFSPKHVDLNVSLPIFDIEELVICTDIRHKKFLEYGAVKDLDHMHARIKFDDYLIWIPKLTIEKVPKEWLE